jgi:hypothetical protein
LPAIIEARERVIDGCGHTCSHSAFLKKERRERGRRCEPAIWIQYKNSESGFAGKRQRGTNLRPLP